MVRERIIRRDLLVISRTRYWLGMLAGANNLIRSRQRRHVPNCLVEQGHALVRGFRLRRSLATHCTLFVRLSHMEFSISPARPSLAYVKTSRYFSASSAAIQPVPALVTACL